MRGFAGHDDDCGTLMSATAFGYVLASPGFADKTLQAHKRWFHRWAL